MKLTREIRDLKEYKESNGLTYDDLSKMMNISRITLNLWIIGKVKPNQLSLGKVKSFLNYAYLNKTIQNINGIEYVTSMQVAEWIGKAHRNLVRDIRKMIDDLNKLDEQEKKGMHKNEHPHQNIDITVFTPKLYFIESTYTHPQNKMNLPCFLVSFKGCEMIANKMNGIKQLKFTALYIDEFHKLADGNNQNSSDAEKIVSNIFNQSFNTPNQEPQQTELLQDESSELTPLEQDMNYLQQRINRLKDIKDLDQLHDELDTVTKLSQFMKIEHKLD